MRQNSITLFAILLLGFAPEPCFLQEIHLEQPYFISARHGEQHMSLAQNWQLTHLDKPISNPSDLDNKEYLPVNKPTSVQMAYFKAGKLPNPYEHLNSEKYLWIEKQVWYYRKSFTPDKNQKQKYAFLTFEGLDYFSKVWLNGTLLGEHRGMFGGPTIEVSEHLKYGEPNQLVVEVKSGNYNQWDTFDWRNPGKIVKPRTVARGGSHKPFFALGMWQGVRVDFVPKIHLERPYLVTKKAENNTAHLHLSLEMLANKHSLKNQLHPWGNEQISNYSQRKAPSAKPFEKETKVKIEFWHDGQLEFEKVFDQRIFNQHSWLEEDIAIPEPKLWWPNGMGDPNLYKVKTSLWVTGEKVDEIEFDFGIRSVAQVPTTAPRTSDRWKNWQFVVNNRPIFVKGVNWMAVDVLLDLPVEKYDWVLSTARDAGIQLIRVWGGGLLEPETFYKLCNRYGLMVWQDFPKANSNTPEWPQEVWEAQVVQNIFRLRNHPSLAVWCGGNEFNPYSKENATTMNVLERSLDDFDPSRLWIRTSPDHGSTHLYPDFDPIWYKKQLGIIPFIAETGIHSVPEAQSLYEIVDEKEFKNLGGMYDDGFKANHPEFIQHFMEYRPGRVPRMLSRASHIDNVSNPSLESISEATQIGAGEFYQILSQGLQSNYPVTTGLMPWVFKRPWPTVAAIHLLDGFGQPSAPYYFLKRTYEPIHVALLPDRLLWKAGEEFPVNISILNATESKGAYTVSVKILDSEFAEQYSASMDVEVPSGPSVTEHGMKSYTIPKDFKSQYFFVLAEIRNGNNELISRSVYWPRTIAQMENPEYYEKYTSEPMAWPTLNNGPWLKPITARTKTNLALRVLEQKEDEVAYHRCKVLVKNTGKYPAFMTQLNVKGGKRLFRATDNFFWMAPGEERILEVDIKWREAVPKKPYFELSAWNSRAVIKKL